MADYYKRVEGEFLNFSVMFEDGVEISFSDDYDEDQDEEWVCATLYHNGYEIDNYWKEGLNHTWYFEYNGNSYIVDTL